MSKIEDIISDLKTRNYFYHDSRTNYVRILDTPNIWLCPNYVLKG